MSICPDIESIIKPCANYFKAPNGLAFCTRINRYRCIEDIVRNNPVLSSSSSGTYNQCLRKFYHTYIQGFQVIEFNFKPASGIIFHAIAAGMHSGNDTHTQKGKKLYDKISEQYKDTELPIELLLIKPVANAYLHHGFHKIGGQVEQSKIVNSGKYQLLTIVDLINNDGTKLLDWKYTTNPDYYTHFTTKHQAGLYLLSYPEAKSITYFLIRIPYVKRGSNETIQEFQDRIEKDMIARKDHYFILKTFHRAEYNLPQIEQELFHISEEIIRNLDKPLYFWRQNYSACWQFGKMCDFYACCEAGIMPETLPHIYKKRDIEKVIYQEKEKEGNK